MSDSIIPVILCGGSGTRLWPLSRNLQPKQFHALVGTETLLQATANRVRRLGTEIQPPDVICNEEHRFLVAEQLQEIGVERACIYLEPAGRNTAPAVAAIALARTLDDVDPVLLVLPADHIVKDIEEFRSCVKVAFPIAMDGVLVTFGITPTSPETGYGYIRKSTRNQSAAKPDRRVFEIQEFIEKPGQAMATQYVESGEYMWNSGMFMFRARRFIDELNKQRPEIVRCVQQSVNERSIDGEFVRLERSAFEKCPSDSIDYAVMEHAKSRVVVELNAGWSDVGSWGGLWETVQRDKSGNYVRGDALLSDVSNSFVRAGSRLVAVIGVDDVVIIETSDSVLVSSKDHAHKVKDLVAKLNESNREEAQLHKKVPRPWGSYQGLDQGERFQVKRLILKLGAKISLQLHHRRSEHWVVVSGTARVSCGDETKILNADESTYIPVGTKHQLENVGDTLLEVIEVQTGTYFDEDDIERFEDDYGRV